MAGELFLFAGENHPFSNLYKPVELIRIRVGPKQVLVDMVERYYKLEQAKFIGLPEEVVGSVEQAKTGQEIIEIMSPHKQSARRKGWYDGEAQKVMWRALTAKFFHDGNSEGSC